MPAGYMIRVTTPGNGEALMQEYFQIALDDAKRAKEVARLTARLANDVLVEVAGELSFADLRNAGMLRGEGLSVRKSIPGSERQDRAKR